jgi:hypothetical protein
MPAGHDGGCSFVEVTGGRRVTFGGRSGTVRSVDDALELAYNNNFEKHVK